MIGARLTHYEITARLGAGGMSEVYRATDTKPGREVDPLEWLARPCDHVPDPGQRDRADPRPPRPRQPRG